MPRIRYRRCYVDFAKPEFVCDVNGPLKQPQVTSVWYTLPTTGAAWIERGRLLAQQYEGARVFDLGPVADGVSMSKIPRSVKNASYAAYEGPPRKKRR